MSADNGRGPLDPDDLPTLERGAVAVQTPPAKPTANQPGDLTPSGAASEQPPALGKRFFNARTAVSFAIGFAILLFLFTRVQVDVNGIVDRLKQANPALLALAVLAYYSTFIWRGLRWRLLLRNVGFHEHQQIRLPGLGGLVEIIFLSWFANCIVPAKLGDAYRAYLLKRDAEVSFTTTLGTVVSERIIDVLVLFTLMVAASSLSFGQALPGPVVLIMQLGLVLVGLVVAGLVAMKKLRGQVLRLVPDRYHRRYEALELGVLGSFSGNLPAILLLTLASWGGEVLRLAFVTLALGGTGAAPSVIVFVALAASLATTLPLTPAGLGFAEGTIIAIFLLAASAGLAPGMDEHTAASIALLDRGISYWSVIVVGLVVYLVSKRK